MTTKIFINIGLLSAIGIMMLGCSTKETVYKPYPSSSHIYKHIIDKNRLTWKQELMPDMEEFSETAKARFSSVDNYKNYLAITNNKKTLPKLKEPKKEKTGLHYSDTIFANEYGF